MKYCITFLLLLFSTGVFAEHKTIYIVLSGEDKIYYDIASSLQDTLHNSHVLPEHIKVLSVQNFHFETISPNDLLVPIGKPASEEAVNYQSSNSIIYSFINQEFITKIKPNSLSQQWAATVVNQPIERLISAADKLVRNNYKNKIILVISKGNVQLKQQIEAVPPLINGQVEIVEVGPKDIVAKIVEESLFNAAALISTHEKDIWSSNNAKWLLRQAYNYQVPVVGDSERFLKAGALVSVYSSLDNIAKTTQKLIAQWQKYGKIIDSGLQYSDYQIGTNKSVGQALHFTQRVLHKIEEKQ